MIKFIRFILSEIKEQFLWNCNAELYRIHPEQYKRRKFMSKYEQAAVDLLLKASKDILGINNCCCPMNIGHPLVKKHSSSCINLQQAVKEVEGVTMTISVYIKGKEGVQLIDVNELINYNIVGSKDGLALLEEVKNDKLV